MNRRIRVASLVLGIALLGAATARAERGPKLEYNVHPSALGCPSEDEFRDAVQGRLGHDPFTPESTRRLLVDVRVEDGELSATGALVEADGSSAGLRRIAGKPEACPEVVIGMALAVSLAMNAILGETPEEPRAPTPAPPAPESPPDPKPKPIPLEKTPPRSPRAPPVDSFADPRASNSRESSEVELGGGVTAHGTLGVGPGVGMGAGVMMTGRKRPWSLSVEGRFDGLSTGMSLERGSVSSTLLAGVLAPCGHFGPALACALGLAGAIRAESKDVSTPGDDGAPYAAAGVRLGAEWQFSQSVILQSRLDLLATLLPVSIELGNEQIWTSPPVSAALGAGLLGLLP